MDVVKFSEGILGIDKTSGVLVANCLKKVAINEEIQTSLAMLSVADRLDFGQKVDISAVREIGEKPLSKTQRLFLSL